jgi:hypothetical protein
VGGGKYTQPYDDRDGFINKLMGVKPLNEMTHWEVKVLPPP